MVEVQAVPALSSPTAPPKACITPARSVIVPHLNDLPRLARLLEALAGMDRRGTEVVVVDNGSTADLTPLRAAYPFARFVVEPAPGAAAARNRGVAESRGDTLLFLDADCVPAPDWLDRAAALPAGRVVGGRIDLFDETPAPRGWR